MTSSSSSSPEILPSTSTDPQHEKFSYKHATHDEVLEELTSRFIVNLPEEELASLERICFQVEQAHWFYEDFMREENPKLPSLPLKKFSAMLFRECPLLHRWRDDHEEAFTQFMQYKTRVPVCGAIMLNDSLDKCVLVKGWKASSGWGFPKGKINQSEPPHVCAVREVLEETGYDLAGQIVPDDVLTTTIKDQKISLYIVSGVPEDYPFMTKTRKEISKIEWFRLVDLPTWKRNKTVAGKFYLISPFIGPLKAFINARRPTRLGRTRRAPAPALPTTEEEDEGADLVSVGQGQYADYSDATQESSSQSSSADNGDPQTPSPQYIQAVARAPPHIAASHPEPVDPHMARLLSSLTLSATSTVVDEVSAKKVANAQLAPSTTSFKMPAGRSVSHEEPQPALPVSPPQQSQRTSSSPQASKAPASRQAPVAAAPVNPPSLIAPTSPISPRSRGLGSRRTASTADISPYLSRTIEAPSSAKTLKQLALLESIANESEKVTPTLANRGLPSVGSEFSNAGRFSALPGPMNAPSTLAPNLNDLHVIYSSNPVAGPPSNAHFPSTYHPLPQPDPFQVRPHTSLSYRSPMPGHGIVHIPQPAPYVIPSPMQFQPFFQTPSMMPLPPAGPQMMQPFVPPPMPRPSSQFSGAFIQGNNRMAMASPGDSAGFNPRGAVAFNPLLSILNAKQA
ncbi:mRNA-decapping enzyme subunit 2 [Pleurotus ostreatus]|uniref:mRNA-decapping enzyme subunit 2 n=2 Tax=Pleurotus TaxID=5320 RepID=A0A8H7DVJ8_PLEOS|nr:mRNA-decapping enzyme subunit 2 [Pleurotus ostreatus]KAF7436805.1 mRNA-decapping enzyme subunit 2 [Pleurotus ostreatus]KAG9222798.1 hypothetical protein CCMSSC00406_0000513 [Pleurotus cornucopiae]